MSSPSVVRDSWAEPWPTTHSRHISVLQKLSTRSNARRFRKSNSSTFKDLQTQIQGFSRTMSVFKDFPGLENLEKKFQGLSRTRKSPVVRSVIS